MSQLTKISRRQFFGQCIGAGAGLAFAAGTSFAHEPLPSSAIPRPTRAARALVRGAIDIHTHLDPDSFGPHSNQAKRSLDVIDMARRARAAGMRGFVMKQHHDQTAQLAYLARKEVPGVEVYGMLCCNLAVGGLNPVAVHHFTEVIGGYARIVSLPTWDAENFVRKSRNPNRSSVTVSRDGALLPEVIEVLKVVASAKIRDSDAKLALATGHVSAEEALLVISEAKRLGIEQIVATHAIGHTIDMTVEQMKQAAALGAYVEFVANFLTLPQAHMTPQIYYDAIREIGPKNIIFSSDGGQANRPYPDDLLAQAAFDMREMGITDAELRMMMVENPAKLLGLPVQAT